MTLTQLPDELVRLATAVDTSADGLVDHQITENIDGVGIRLALGLCRELVIDLY